MRIAVRSRALASAACLTVAGAAIVLAQAVPGDSKRGAVLIRELGCAGCHGVGSEGGTSAPDLGRARGRNYTPAAMASAMWNHAPAMWSAMRKQAAQAPAVTESQAADLFAYFHSIRFFDKLGDAAAGKRVFTSKHCSKCHGLTSPLPGGAPSVAAWASLASPVLFAQRMWNHAPQMEAAMAGRNLKWVRLTSQDLTDLLVYVQNLPETRGQPREFSLEATGRGKAVFNEEGCADCHQGRLALENRLSAATSTDFAVAMWNHAPDMAEHARRTGKMIPRLDAEEMLEIISYLWYRQIYAELGDTAKGLRTFERKKCSLCHSGRSTDGPDLKQRLAARAEPFRPFSLVAVLWRHGPAMLERMEAKRIDWPRFSTREMADLIAYLNSIAPAASPGAE